LSEERRQRRPNICCDVVTGRYDDLVGGPVRLMSPAAPGRRRGSVTPCGARRRHPAGEPLTASGKPRHLYLDIEGHRNEAGGFDRDALELQKEFLIDFFMHWLTEVHMSLGAYRNGHQREDLPDRLNIFEGLAAATRAEGIAALAREGGQAVFDTETSEWVQPDGTREPHN